MDLKDSNTQKILLGALAFFIIVYFWYSRAYSKYDHLIDQKSQQFERITTDLRNVELKAKSLDALKAEYTDLVGRYHQIEALLPEVKQIPSFLVQLHTASSLTGTKITGLQPLPTSSEEFYNIASFEISLTGAYHDMGKFIGYVANFPFIVNVTDMQLTATEVAISSSNDEEATGETQKPETLAAIFTLSTYYVKEKERLKEITL